MTAAPAACRMCPNRTIQYPREASPAGLRHAVNRGTGLPTGVYAGLEGGPVDVQGGVCVSLFSCPVFRGKAKNALSERVHNGSKLNSYADGFDELSAGDGAARGEGSFGCQTVRRRNRKRNHRSQSCINNRSTVVFKCFANLNASVSEGSYLSFSIELMVCLDTLHNLANSSCESFSAFLISLIRFFNPNHHISFYTRLMIQKIWAKPLPKSKTDSFRSRDWLSESAQLLRPI